MTEKIKSKLCEEELNKIAQRARYDKAIKLWDLIYIMAADDTCNDSLSELWEVFILTGEGSSLMPPVEYKDGRLDKDGNLKFKEDRVGAWWWLLSRLAGITEIEETVFRNLPEIVGPLTLYNKEKGGLRKAGIGEERNEDQFVKLDDLEALFDEIERQYGLPKPLPTRLFVKRESEITEEKERHKPGYEKEQSALPPTMNASQYAFYKTGDTWKIIFNDEEHAGLKQGGFKYLHYLIANENKKEGFTAIELDKAFNPKPKGTEAWIDSETIFEDEEPKGELSVKDLKALSTFQEKFDEATIQNLKHHLTDLQRDIDAAERDCDFARKDELQREKQQIEDYLMEDIHLLDGTIRSFRDDAKTVSDRVNKAMGRAIKALSGEAYEHFNEAFRPHGQIKRYAPTKPIPWVLEKK